MPKYCFCTESWAHAYQADNIIKAEKKLTDEWGDIEVHTVIIERDFIDDEED